MTKGIQFTETDTKLKRLCARRRGGLSKSRKNTYNTVFNQIYDLTGYTPSDIIRIAKEEEKGFIKNGIVEKIDIDDRTVTKIQYDYAEWLKEQTVRGKPFTEQTLETKMLAYRSLLSEYQIEKPLSIDFNTAKERIRDSDIPTWKDVEKAMTLIKSPRDKSIIGMAATTGLRVSDIVKLTIDDLITACTIYFVENEEHSLENLLKKNPDNIVPCWELNPQKTNKFKIFAVTFNTPEVTNYIFDYLKYRVNLNKRKGGDGNISVDDPLFENQRGGFLQTNSVGARFREINRKMGNERDRNGRYSKFRIHNLRSLFQTTCRRSLPQVVVKSDKTFEGDVVNVFTGHSTKDNPLAYAYEAIPNDSHDSYVRKAYEALIPFLSIQPTDVKDFKTENYMEWEKEKEAIQKRMDIQAVQTQRELNEKDKEIENLKQQLANQDQQYKETIAQIKTSVDSQVADIRNEMNTNLQYLEAIKTTREMHENVSFNFEIDFAIKKYYQKHHDLNFDDVDAVMKKRALCKLAYDEAIKDENNFENTDDYIATLFEIVNVRCKRKPALITETIEQMQNKNDDSIDLMINEIINMFVNDSELMKLTGCDTINLRTVVQNYVFENPDLEQKAGILTIDEKENIIDDILAECVKFNAQNN